MSRIQLRLMALVTLVVFTTVLCGGAAIAQDEPVRVKIKKVKRCEEGECSEALVEAMHHVVVMKEGEGGEAARKIFIGDDGEVREISGDDGGVVWVGEAGHSAHARGNFTFSGAASRGAFLGVHLTELTSELRAHFGVPEDAGVMVSKVLEDSAAFRGGLYVGDIITAVNGEPVAGAGALTRAIRGYEPGDTVTLEVWRDGQVQTVSATLEKHSVELRHPRMFQLRCEDGDCEDVHALHFGDDFHFSFDCGEDSCELEVACEDGSCSCSVNGEAADCEALHLGHDR